jgi:hypothetical protein
VLEGAGLPADDDFAHRVARAHEEAQLMAVKDARNLEKLHLDDGSATPVVRVPAFDGDVHDVRALALVAGALVGDAA